jgi:hypothetical protein
MPPKHPLLKKYRENLNTFLNNLEKTSIHIVYFTVDKQTKKLVRGSKNVFSRWNRSDGVCYVLPGASGGWCYVYIGKELTKFVTLGEDSGLVGNHLTFGVGLYNGQCILELHHTQYVENSEYPNQYGRIENTCDVMLEANESVVPSNRTCYYQNNITLEMMFTKERLSVIQDVSRVYYGRYTGEGGGIRGKGGRKRYLVGGAVFDDGFLTFLQTYVLEPVADIRPDMEGVRLIYDERGELAKGSHKQILLLYEFQDIGMHLYRLPAKKALEAYQAMQEIDKGTAKEAARRCVTEFLGTVDKEVKALQEIFEG